MKGAIGLEIHTYLVTKEKLFCKCIASRERGLQPNVNICPICTGQPGAKPYSPNIEAVKKAIAVGLMLGCKINNNLKWIRKHYDWPDLPKGYQNTMSGAHSIPLGYNGNFFEIRIRSIHLEEDPASWDPKTGYVDYNRSGLPLVEIVTEPEFSFAKEVADWLGKLVHALSYLKTIDSNAGIKVDINVNIPGKTERVEIKNINSIENVVNAINYELERQLREGSVRETRRFDDSSGKTISMRLKEKQDDYRFISDPDLLDIVIDGKIIEDINSKLPEMPYVKIEKLIKKYNIDEKNAIILAKNIDIAEFFEKVVVGGIDAKFALPWITIELLRVLNWNKTSLDKIDIKSEHFISLLKLVRDGKITELQAKKIINNFVPKSFDPSKSEEKISNEKELEKIINKVLERNPRAVENYKDGDTKVFNFLMGEIMKYTNRRADFMIAKKILNKLLS